MAPAWGSASQRTPSTSVDPPPDSSAPGDADPRSDSDAIPRELIFKGAEDKLEPTETHYVKTNEVRHDVWFSALAERGGVYVGVGADQNYTLIAASRSRVAFLLDIDQRVVDIHRVYEALIEHAPTPDDLLALFAADTKDRALDILQGHVADEPPADRVRYLRSYRAARETLRRHLGHVRGRKTSQGPSSWLSNPTWYDAIRRMFREDRIRSMAGDLAGTRSMQTIAANARAMNLPVRVLYLSNAEEYFRYTTQFRNNVRALPGDEHSLVLRTIYSDDWEHAARLWNYQLQPLSDFQRRLAAPQNRSRNPMLRRAARDGVVERTTETKGLSRVAMSPVSD
ncbi:MAG: hypothetical protein B7733_26575 [Myxococcales bacterium FL481]|nr:MAG: hypothetical protein B7733_26575 [Myxococcales bacterium FL481]